MTRVQFPNTNQRPLADTVTGAAGEVTGTERATLQTATSVNTASAIVRRDASGNFAAGVMTGTAAAANALNAGTTDGDKLHNLGGTGYSVNSGGGSLSSTYSNAAPSFALATGVYLVTGQVSVTNFDTITDDVHVRLGNSSSAAFVSAKTTVRAGESRVISLSAIIGVTGTQTVVLQAYAPTSSLMTLLALVDAIPATVLSSVKIG
jgi:hypothetical protein